MKVEALTRKWDSKDEETKAEPRIKLVPFDQIKLGKQRRDFVKGMIPRVGPTVIWGEPKCGKSFWVYDLVMHAALGWSYRGRRVQEGPVVYCAFEGQSGIDARIEAFRIEKLDNHEGLVPFYLVPVTLDLVKDHGELVTAIRQQLGETAAVAVVLDTLNRSIAGSESSDTDMTAYVQAAEAIREAFDCAVIIVHHCGLDKTRARGHTALRGAAAAMISVKRDAADNIIAEVEDMRDGPSGDRVASRLESVVVGTDEDGEEITSCIVVEAQPSSIGAATAGPRLTANQRTMYEVLDSAGQPLSTDEWTERAREAGLGSSRKAWAWDLRNALKKKGLVYEGMNGWAINK